MAQSGLTVITAVKSGQVDNLEKVLLQIGEDIQDNTLVKFCDMPSVHFACWVILKKGNTDFPDELVLELNYDGETDNILLELIQHGSAGLDQIYSLCEGYPGPSATRPTAFVNYLKAHVQSNAAFYVGCRGQSLPSIRNAADIRAACETLLDSAEGACLRDKSPSQVRAALQAHIHNNPDLKPISSTRSLSEIRANASRANNAVKGVLVLLGLMALAPVFGGLFYNWLPPTLAMLLLVPLPLTLFLLCFAVVLRINEFRDAAIGRPMEGFVDQRVAGKEDVFDMNHMTTLTDIKPGPFRLLTLKFVLWLINLLAGTVFIVGDLGGIPTIHFARWVFVDNGKRLLFFSNYDGSWESYMGDFIDRANQGLTAIWSNTTDFPRTNWLAWAGARRVDEFKRWTRVHNVFNQVWYTAYPEQTVRNIVQDITFREGLEGPMDDHQAQEWLRLL